MELNIHVLKAEMNSKKKHSTLVLNLEPAIDKSKNSETPFQLDVWRVTFWEEAAEWLV